MKIPSIIRKYCFKKIIISRKVDLDFSYLIKYHIKYKLRIFLETLNCPKKKHAKNN